MKYQEMRTVWSDQQLKEAELKGHFNIEVGEHDGVIVGDETKGVSIHFGPPYDKPGDTVLNRMLFPAYSNANALLTAGIGDFDKTAKTAPLLG